MKSEPGPDMEGEVPAADIDASLPVTQEHSDLLLLQGGAVLEPV